MTEMINFAIDLGTTNSLVAKFNKGRVEVFKDPLTQGIQVLPSVVAFRKDRILVGRQARTFAEKDMQNVVWRFKRKMGTTESFEIKALGQSKTPVELSAFVLKELKTFIHTGETPQAVVVTVPASFDIVQCKATTEAAYAAGFKQVVLLQEPIAASLAYANSEKSVDLRNSQWIVYDLGGGTFDVALVKVVEGELKVVDHEGNNYLGGMDFDALIVEKLIVPQVEKRGKFTNLLAQMKSETGRFNKLWYSLLLRAEEARIELSAHSSAEIDLTRSSVEDEDGKQIDEYIPVIRSEYEALIKGAVDNTAEMLKRILTRNSLRPEDLKFVLMVGGVTYTPFVRKRIEELLGIPVNTGIDPTNAIVVGAAYYAGTKQIKLPEKLAEKRAQPGALRVKYSYNAASQDREEMFQAKVEGDVSGLFYRITRSDGGYDSGLKKLAPRIAEDLPLQENDYNNFGFRICDAQNNPIPRDFDPIQIAQGIYNVAGQMLPQDLGLVLDDIIKGGQRTEPIFLKKCVLPAEAKKTVEASRAIIHGSDDKIHIIVVEGPSENPFYTNKHVGQLSISGKSLERDLLRGMEIDLTFQLSESQTLTVEAYVNPSGQRFKQTFDVKRREVDVETLTEELENLGTQLEKERDEALSNEDYEVVEKLEKLRETVDDLHVETTLLTLDDRTDDRYKLEDSKRKIAQELYQLTAGKRLERLRSDYQSAKDEVTGIVTQSGNDRERQQLREVVAQEHTFLNSENPQKLEAAIDQLHGIEFQILRRTPDFLIGWFQHLVQNREMFNDQLQAKNLIEAGKKHIAADDYDRLVEVNVRLYHLLPEEVKDSQEMRPFTGIT